MESTGVTAKAVFMIRAIKPVQSGRARPLGLPFPRSAPIAGALGRQPSALTSCHGEVLAWRIVPRTTGFSGRRPGPFWPRPPF